MFGFLSPVLHALDPLWTLMATKTWTCIAVLAVLTAVFLALHLPIVSAFTAAVLALLLMWKAEHEQKSAAQRSGAP